MTDATNAKGWGDRLVIVLLVTGIAGLGFAAGRFTVDPGPQSVQDAMELAQAGELPFSSDGSAAAPGGGAPGSFAGGPPPGRDSATTAPDPGR